MRVHITQVELGYNVVVLGIWGFEEEGTQALAMEGYIARRLEREDQPGPGKTDVAPCTLSRYRRVAMRG